MLCIGADGVVAAGVVLATVPSALEFDDGLKRKGTVLSETVIEDFVTGSHMDKSIASRRGSMERMPNSV